MVAKIQIITFFAYLHDGCRWNEGRNPSSEPRAAAYKKQHRSLIDLDVEQFKLLITASSGHTFSKSGSKTGVDKSIVTSWDADRLDLRRVGNIPDPNLGCTKFSTFVSSKI